jgi:hypothetical protein
VRCTGFSCFALRTSKDCLPIRREGGCPPKSWRRSAASHIAGLAGVLNRHRSRAASAGHAAGRAASSTS